jgi:hypothetical protein
VTSGAGTADADCGETDSTGLWLAATGGIVDIGRGLDGFRVTGRDGLTAVFVLEAPLVAVTFLVTFAGGFLLETIFRAAAIVAIFVVEFFTPLTLLLDLTVFFAVRVFFAAFPAAFRFGVVFFTVFAIPVSQPYSKYVDNQFQRSLRRSATLRWPIVAISSQLVSRTGGNELARLTRISHDP